MNLAEQPRYLGRNRDSLVLIASFPLRTGRLRRRQIMRLMLGVTVLLSAVIHATLHFEDVGDVALAACNCIDRRYHAFAHRDGIADARGALSRGKIFLLSQGASPPWFENYAAILKAGHGIEVRRLPGGLIPTHLQRYMRDHNQTMTDHIRAKFGPDVVDLAAEKAKAEYEEAHPIPKIRVIWMAGITWIIGRSI